MAENRPGSWGSEDWGLGPATYALAQATRGLRRTVTLHPSQLFRTSQEGQRSGLAMGLERSRDLSS
ncbi:MAG: hypothetical protein HYX86_06220 [Chloroflexi bacterium]|nr:hypothetical protein [Chloroflexota bacterium]